MNIKLYGNKSNNKINFCGLHRSILCQYLTYIYEYVSIHILQLLVYIFNHVLLNIKRQHSLLKATVIRWLVRRPRKLVKSDDIFFQKAALNLSSRASLITVNALQNRDSPNSAIKPLCRSAPEYSAVYHALKRVILTATVHRMNLRSSIECGTFGGN